MDQNKRGTHPLIGRWVSLNDGLTVAQISSVTAEFYGLKKQSYYDPSRISKYKTRGILRRGVDNNLFSEMKQRHRKEATELFTRHSQEVQKLLDDNTVKASIAEKD